MQTNRKSIGTLKSDRYIQATIMDEWPLWQVLLYHQIVPLSIILYNFMSPKLVLQNKCYVMFQEIALFY